MKLDELTKSQKAVLKQNIVFEREGSPSWDQLASAEYDISDDELEEKYKDTEFVPEDFETQPYPEEDEDNRVAWMRGAFVEWATDILTTKCYELDTKTAHSNSDIKKAIAWCQSMVIGYLTGNLPPTKTGYIIAQSRCNYATKWLGSFNEELNEPRWIPRRTKAQVFETYQEALRVGNILFDDNVDGHLVKVG